MGYKGLKCAFCKQTEFVSLENGMYKCIYCQGLNYQLDNSTQHSLYSAQNYSSTYDFDKADDLYSKVLQETESVKTKAMCYYGKLLVEFEVNYIKGYKRDSNRMVVTFSNYDKRKPSIKQSYYYKALMELPLSNAEKKKYEESINELDVSYQKIPEELSKTPEYDVFICVKISPKVNEDDNTEDLANTRDSQLAESIYNNLKTRDVKVFYSEKEKGYISDDSEIISALLKSKMMLIVCGSTEYIESRWVQSEWRRWVNLIDQKERLKNTLILFSRQDFTKPKLLQNIIEYESHEQNELQDLLVERSKETKEVKELVQELVEKTPIVKEQNEQVVQKVETTKPVIVEEKKKDEVVETSTIKKEPTITRPKKETPIEDFEIENRVLKKYKGKDSEVIIPEGVKTIGEKAFFWDHNLTSIEIPKGVTSIGDSAFSYCERLVEVYNLSKLNITIGSIDNGRVGYYAKVIHTSIEEESRLIEKDNYVFIKDNNNKYYLVSYKGKEEKLVLPSDIDGNDYEINDNAFYWHSSLTSIVIPESVTSLGDWAFSGCISLTSIVIPEGLTSIGDYAFYNCSNLKEAFYKGTQQEWEKVEIDKNNSNFISALLFYSQSKPLDSNKKYWHYVSGVPTKW